MPASKIDINLLAQADINARPLGKLLRWSLTYGRYIIIGTQIIVLLAFFSRFKLDQELSDLHTRIDEKVNIIETLSSIETNTRKLQNKIQILANLESSRSIYLQIISDLARVTTNEIVINQLIFNQNQLLINGKSGTNTGFSNLLSYLRKNERFSQITLEEVSRNKDDSLSFKISLQLQQNSPKTESKQQ